MLDILVHEFNHSFVNHVVETRRDELGRAGDRIYKDVQTEMRAQAYGNWQTMLNESVVRAAVIRYLLANEGQAAADREIRSQRGVGFVWMDELAALLGEYESQRARYPTLTSFLPRIVEYYNDLSSRIDHVVADFDSHRPSITASSVRDGDKNVDPALTEITVRFDRPMGPGVSLNAANGGEIPRVLSYAFDSTRTAFTVRVQLVSGKDYGLRFTGFGFADPNGYPLKNYDLRFRTR